MLLPSKRDTVSGQRHSGGIDAATRQKTCADPFQTATGDLNYEGAAVTTTNRGSGGTPPDNGVRPWRGAHDVGIADGNRQKTRAGPQVALNCC